jgi:hypothetical protein
MSTPYETCYGSEGGLVGLMGDPDWGYKTTASLSGLNGRLQSQALPEAPVSCNVHITIAGRDVQVTLRGVDEGEVLARLERLLACYPVTSEAPGKQCPIHKVPMQDNHKDGRTWWSHRQGDTWCKGK